MTSTPSPRHPSSHTDAASPRRLLSARSPEDLLAAVPVVLGFEPRDSAVLMTFGGPRPFHARVDLPGVSEHVAEMVSMLLEPALRHEVHAVALVVYAAGTDLLAAETTRALRHRFEEAGLPVRVLLRTDGRRWWLADRPPSEATTYDLSAHPFRVQSVLDGKVTHPSRAALADTLATDPDAVDRAVLELEASPGPVRDLDAVDVAVIAAHHVHRGTCLSDAELVAVAVGIERPAVRDGAWTLITRDSARAHVALWSDAVRRTPPDLLGGPAAVLGFAAWLAGDGALAWCAVDRARGADPDNTLATLVADLLAAAVPPTAWADLRTGDLQMDGHGTDGHSRDPDH